ncbi:hypothetical protein [Metabacillus idriensis]|nr:hypothetical protein [Metabacillus idriensis]
MIRASNITFHRAFDEVDYQVTALGVLQKYPAISRVAAKIKLQKQ